MQRKSGDPSDEGGATWRGLCHCRLGNPLPWLPHPRKVHSNHHRNNQDTKCRILQKAPAPLMERADCEERLAPCQLQGCPPLAVIFFLLMMMLLLPELHQKIAILEKILGLPSTTGGFSDAPGSIYRSILSSCSYCWKIFTTGASYLTTGTLCNADAWCLS